MCHVRKACMEILKVCILIIHTTDIARGSRFRWKLSGFNRIRNFIGDELGAQFLDDVIISAEIHRVKPDKDFYEYILRKYNLLPKELLFLDDNVKNVESAKELGIKVIKVNKNTNILDEIIKNINV